MRHCFLGENACFVLISNLCCKLTLLVNSVLFLPNLMSVLVALDRINCITRPIWYREKCTPKTAKYQIGSVVVISIVIGIPQALSAEILVDERSTGCEIRNPLLDHILLLVGIPATVLVTILTVKLVIALKKKNSEDQQRSSAVKKDETNDNSVKFIPLHKIFCIYLLVHQGNTMATGR